MKVKPLDLTDLQFKRFFNPGKSGTCLECNMEWRIVFENNDDARIMKNLLTRVEKIKEKGKWTHEDLVQIDKLLADADSMALKYLLIEGRAMEEFQDVEKFDKRMAEAVSTTEKHLIMQGGALEVLMVKIKKIMEKEMTDEDVEEVRALKAMGDHIVAKHLRMEGK